MASNNLKESELKHQDCENKPLERLNTARDRYLVYRPIKILIVGDASVGKTSAMLQFTSSIFAPSYMATIAIDFKVKTAAIKGKKVRLQIWDTAGQERFHEITHAYYRGAHGIMLVYDITNRKSFENIPKWLGKTVEYAREDAQKLLIGNKLDLESKRAVSRREGEDLAAEMGIPFLETSAKSSKNIDKAFFDLSREIVDKIVIENPEVIEDSFKEPVRVSKRQQLWNCLGREIPKPLNRNRTIKYYDMCADDDCVMVF